MSHGSELAAFGVATVYEAAGRTGLVNLSLVQGVPGSSVAGPARTVRCGQDDNLMVHASLSHVQPGEVLVLTMPIPRPIALVGDLIAQQAVHRGVAGILVDAALRDLASLPEVGLPIWARWTRVTGATKSIVGELDVPVMVGGALIRSGDLVVLDADGAVVVPTERAEEVLEASTARQRYESQARDRYRSGALAYDVLGLRALVENESA